MAVHETLSKDLYWDNLYHELATLCVWLGYTGFTLRSNQVTL